jgi:hypothetical protein
VADMPEGAGIHLAAARVMRGCRPSGTIWAYGSPVEDGRRLRPLPAVAA